ncbi:hypothetical protein TD95_001537 [Thielaviopsis punctulata]|uniref:Jacalin-type lectin domain-containing protein n=1 Tax=Thielaviopsis punctulata TaxID=72032 RepID=A0A0F4ZBX1_9PEZI|nr:hypothetical protein TD95_001537 [Thielaviopsis punctulata]
MPRFSFKELRRRSKASFRTDSSSDSRSNRDDTTTGSLTPPSLLGNDSDPGLLGSPTTSHPIPPPSRPQTNRQSVSGMAGLGSPPNTNTTAKGSLPVSQYAPRIANVSEGSWVYQKVLLIYGTIGEPKSNTLDGTLTVSRLDDGFPPISWPVSESNFKALVYLQPGPNRLRFDFSSPKLANSQTSNPIHASYITVHMMAPSGAPPVQLAIMLGSDSPERFDCPPDRAQREGNDLEVAVRKFRMSAYLWQAFTAEQMRRNRFGRRVFRFDEEWTSGSASSRDKEHGTMRSEARIHIIRSNKTTAQIRDLNVAQQHGPATDKGALFSYAWDAVHDYFKPRPGQKLYVSVLILDAHWDTGAQVIAGHAALGGANGDMNLAIFGSHCLYSYPSSFEEVVPAFTDCTPTDTNHVANDCNEGGSAWETANIGIGAHMHETGHLLGCPHQESGVMLRDYVTLNRSFLTRESYSTRTKSKGGLVTQEDECTWHRLDCLRFRVHPCFRLPHEPAAAADGSIQVFSVEVGSVVVRAVSGIAFVEIRTEGEEVCHAWIEYPLESSNGGIQRQISLHENDVRLRLPESQRDGKLRVSVKSIGGGSVDIDNFEHMCSKASYFKIDTGKMASRSQYLGRVDGEKVKDEVFTSSIKPERIMSKVIVHHGGAVDGLEFVYDDKSSQLFGNRGGSPSVFEFDIRRGEYISGFLVRSGAFIDGIQIMTSLGRKSEVYGNSNGGSAHVVIPPRGYTIRGVSGSTGAWLDSFAIIITK